MLKAAEDQLALLHLAAEAVAVGHMGLVHTVHLGAAGVEKEGDDYWKEDYEESHFGVKCAWWRELAPFHSWTQWRGATDCAAL